MNEELTQLLPANDSSPLKKTNSTFTVKMYEQYGLNSLAERKRVQVADEYLRDTKGASLQLTSDQLSSISRYLSDNRGSLALSTTDLAVLNSAQFEEIHADIRASTAITQQEISKVGDAVTALHADTVRMMNSLQSDLLVVHNNVVTLGENLEQVSNALIEFRSTFERYMERDRMANNRQIAHQEIIRLNQELDMQFRQYAELRTTASGILQANDLSVSTESIISNAEGLCIKTPDYWLAPALVVLSWWIANSRDLNEDKANSGLNAKKLATKMGFALKEAYLRDCVKTPLFFGLVSRRSNNIALANEWFKEYISFQDPRRVDHTCTVLLNIYAGGLMGHGVEEQEILDTMSGWLDELMSDSQGTYALSLVNDWKNTCRELYVKGAPTQRVFQALPVFCALAWPNLQASLQATTLHRELGRFLEYELARRDFAEDDLTLVDQMLGTLVTSFDGAELPLRREMEYQQLIFDLEGDIQLADALRGIKDDILTETKSFVAILSDAARNVELSKASAATHVYALRVEMPWIKRAYEETTQEYRNATPATIPLTVGDFQAQIPVDADERAVVDEYLEFVNEQERTMLEATKPGLLKMIALIGGAVVTLISLFGALAAGGMWWMLLLIGLAAFGFGIYSGISARSKQREIAKEMMRKRQYGTLVIRLVMEELREWNGEYSANEALMDEVLSEMARQTTTFSEGTDLADSAK